MLRSSHDQCLFNLLFKTEQLRISIGKLKVQNLEH